jgi:hypothetical protein
MQIQSKDGRIVINVSDEPVYDHVMPQADFSFIEAPLKPEDTKKLFSNLFSTQRNNHVSLVSVRLPKKLRLKAFGNLAVIEETGFKYHDHITIVSQEEYKHIPSNLTQIGETCVLFTKNEDMNKKATAWFREELGNCSNVWDVGVQDGEKMISKTTSRHFSWEQGLIMSQLSSPLICRKFLVVGIAEPSMAEFAFRFNLNMYVSTTDEISARRVVKIYQKMIEKAENGR